MVMVPRDKDASSSDEVLSKDRNIIVNLSTVALFCRKSRRSKISEFLGTLIYPVRDRHNDVIMRASCFILKC